VSAYALLRPDGTWSLLVVNKDQHNPHPVKIRFQKGPRGSRERVQRRGDDAHLRQRAVPLACEGKRGIRRPEQSSGTRHDHGGEDTVFELPAASISVIRGSLAASQRVR
jgi:hypothetical protein